LIGTTLRDPDLPSLHRHVFPEPIGGHISGRGSSRSRLQARGQRDMWPTTLGVFFGVLTSSGVLCVVPSFEGFTLMERIKWSLIGGVLIAYGVTYAMTGAA
jgi:hypothetical protein